VVDTDERSVKTVKINEPYGMFKRMALKFLQLKRPSCVTVLRCCFVKGMNATTTIMTYLTSLHDQNNSGFFGGPAFIQPIRTIWKVFKKPWLAGKKPALKKSHFCVDHVNRLTVYWGEAESLKSCRFSEE